MIIRARQLAAFQDTVRSRYLDELAGHCRKFAPKLCQIAGEESLRQTVESGLDRALRVGWDQRHLVQLYLELMFTLGSSFDTDPQYPWIAQHLRPSELEDTQTLACRLYAEFANYQESVAGVANKFALAALQRVVQWQGEELRPPVADLDRAMLTVMRKLYPEKAAYLGAESMAEITQRAAAEATGFGLSPTMGTAILGGMMVAFGSGVCSDPLYPWVSRTLTDPLLASPGARLERLFNKVKTYAANAAEYLAGSN